MTQEELRVPTDGLGPHGEGPINSTTDNDGLGPPGEAAINPSKKENAESEYQNSTEEHHLRTPQAIIHTAVDPPVCEYCQQQDIVFFEPACEGCQQILQHPDTSPAHIFAILRQWTASTQQNLELLIRQLLKRGINVNDRDGLTDMTLLHYASKSGAQGMGDPEEACRMITLLLNNGADLFVRCRWTDMTALHYAVYFDVAPVVELLLQHSNQKDINLLCRDFDNGSPLHIACANLCVNSATVLIQHGANPTITDAMGKTPKDCLPDIGSYDDGSVISAMARQLYDLLTSTMTSAQPFSEGHISDECRNALQAAGVSIGSKVVVGGVKAGILRFCGPTEFASGIWTGIELDDPVGKNDGSVMGVSYFNCLPKHGIFAPVSKISRPGILVTSRSPHNSASLSTPRNITHRKVDTSHVSAKVDTGLSRGRYGSTEILEVGDRVLVAGQRRGVIQYSGEANFAPGWWYGIELDRPVGKNDGSVNGRRFFTCKPKYGVFAPPSRVQKIGGSDEDLADSMLSHRNLSSAVSQPILSNTTKNKANRPRSSGGLNSSLGGQSSEFKLCEGMSVFCSGELGVVRYIGRVEFAEGLWLGVELRTPKGRNDGSIQGHRYFSCKPGYGLLVRPSKVTVRGINGAKLLKDYYPGAHVHGKVDQNCSS